jgi:hypothetical protein
MKKHAARIIRTIVIKTTPTGSISTIIQVTIFTSISVMMIESNHCSFQVRHCFEHWSPSGIINELKRDEAGERHPSAVLGIKEAVFDTQMLQGGRVHFRRPNEGLLHLETLQRRAFTEKNVVIVMDTLELQTREVIGGEGPKIQREGIVGVGGDSEPELSDLEL